MKTLLIKIKELRVVNYSRKDDSFDVIINFMVNDEPFTLSKHFVINQKFEVLSHDLIDFVKRFVREKNKPDPRADLLDAITVVHYKDDDEIEMKVIDFFKRFNNHIKDYKNRGYTEGFLTRYKTPDGFSMKIG